MYTTFSFLKQLYYVYLTFAYAKIKEFLSSFLFASLFLKIQFRVDLICG